MLAALDELEAALAGLRVALAGGDREVIARVWSTARDALAIADAVRWTEPAWDDGSIEGLGRAARARPRGPRRAPRARRRPLRDGQAVELGR